MHAVLFMFLFLANGIAQIQTGSKEIFESGKKDKRLSWVFCTKAPVYASPVISKDVVYIGSLDSTFYAIDAKTGEELWHYKTDDGIYSSAAVYRDICYFESGNILYAVNHKGKLQWKRTLCSGEVNNKLDPWDFHHSSPVIYDGVVYIGTEEGFLLGIDAKSGKRVLLCQTLTESAIRTTPVVFEGLVMYGDWEGVFYANRIEDGALALQQSHRPMATGRTGDNEWNRLPGGRPV